MCHFLASPVCYFLPILYQKIRSKSMKQKPASPLFMRVCGLSPLTVNRQNEPSAPAAGAAPGPASKHQRGCQGWAQAHRRRRREASLTAPPAQQPETLSYPAERRHTCRRSCPAASVKTGCRGRSSRLGAAGAKPLQSSRTPATVQSTVALRMCLWYKSRFQADGAGAVCLTVNAPGEGARNWHGGGTG